MPFSKLFPCALVACFILSLLAVSTSAQTEISRPPLAATTTVKDSGGNARLENDPVVLSVAEEEEAAAPKLLRAPAGVARSAGAGYLNQMLLAAIEARLGTPYRLGATGPYRYDCSGFVWSVFQSAGINFERMTARSLWSNFAAAEGDERFKFGTLVFFNNLNHVGIVADANGFYHASSSHGVMYSTFSDYWLARLDGFRRAPLTANELAAAK